MTQAATSEAIGDNVGGADYHMELSGTCDVVGADDRETIRRTRELIGYLPSNFRERAPSKPTTDTKEREVAELAEIVPDRYEQTYDMHAVVEALVDEGVYFEIKPAYAPQLITCFCRFNGEVAGVVAGNPSVKGSILDIDACDKYYRFLQVLDAYGIPLVTLVDTPDFVPGEEQEEKGLLRHFGKIMDTYATATIPKISVVLREAYADAGSIIMGAVKSMGVDLCYAWPIARFAVEASTADYRRIYGKGCEQDAYEGYLNRSREKVDVFDTARSWSAQMVDEIIEPRETRIKIIEALAATVNKRGRIPPRAKQYRTGPN